MSKAKATTDYMQYYYLAGTSPWVVFPSDLNSLVSLNVGVNKISSQKWLKISEIPEVMEAVSDQKLILLSTDKDAGLSLHQVISAKSNPDLVMKIAGGCFEAETLKSWKSDCGDNRNVESILDRQLESI